MKKLLVLLFVVMSLRTVVADPINDCDWARIAPQLLAAADDLAMLRIIKDNCNACQLSGTSSISSAQPAGGYCQPRIFLTCGNIQASVNGSGHLEVGVTRGMVNKTIAGPNNSSMNRDISVIEMWEAIPGDDFLYSNGADPNNQCTGCHNAYPIVPTTPPYNTIYVPPPGSTLFEGILMEGGNDSNGGHLGDNPNTYINDLNKRYCDCCKPNATHTAFNLQTINGNSATSSYCKKTYQVSVAARKDFVCPDGCGGSGQSCCTTGTSCNMGLSCVSGTCKAPSPTPIPTVTPTPTPPPACLPVGQFCPRASACCSGMCSNATGKCK